MRRTPTPNHRSACLMRISADLWNSVYPVILPNDNHHSDRVPRMRRAALSAWCAADPGSVAAERKCGAPALWCTASALHRVRDDRVARLHGFVRECPDDDV